MGNAKPPRGLVAAALSALLAMSAAGAAEAAVDGSRPLICAVTEVAECVEQENCSKGPASLFNLPVLMRVNVQDKVVETIRDETERRTSPILAIATHGDALVLQGADGDMPWVAAIRQPSGRLTVTALRDGAAFVVFGSCAPL
jgi:hypothetical protein